MSKRKEFTELLEDEDLELDRQKLLSMKEMFYCNLDKLREEYISQNISDLREQNQYAEVVTVYKVFEFLKQRMKG